MTDGGASPWLGSRPGLALALSNPLAGQGLSCTYLGDQFRDLMGFIPRLAVDILTVYNDTRGVSGFALQPARSLTVKMTQLFSF